MIGFCVLLILVHCSNSQVEMEPFDNPRKRKPGSIVCRICKVECGTVEGLDLHSQSREHQRKARDMVLNIKQQNKKKK